MMTPPPAKTNHNTYLLGSFIWFLAGLFFLYEFFIRAFMGSVADPLQASLNLTPAAFGLIASAYYMAYSPMQIPVGILMDRFGARVLLSCGALLCAVGTLLFAQAHSFHEAWGARFLMGLGSSVGFISLLTVSLNWFPRRFFGFFAGMAEILGMIGPILSGAPLAYCLIATNNNWRMILEYVGVIGIFLTLLLVFIVRNQPKNVIHTVETQSKLSLMQKLKLLAKIKSARRVALYAFFIYAAIPLIGESWGTPYLQARGFSLTEATGIIASLWLGMGLGSPAVGLISDILRRRTLILGLCGALGIITSFLFATTHTHSVVYLTALLFLIGVAAGGQTLSFAAMAESVPNSVKGTAMGFNNFAVMLGGMLSQILAGSILNHFWNGLSQNITALPIYGYQIALLLGTLCFALSLLMCFFLKETFSSHVTL